MFKIFENIKNIIELLINIIFLPIRIVEVLSDPFKLRQRKEEEEVKEDEKRE